MHFDVDGTGKIPVSEMRYIMCQLGGKIDEPLVDDMLKVLCPEGQTHVNIKEFTEIIYGGGPAKKGKGDGKKKKGKGKKKR